MTENTSPVAGGATSQPGWTLPDPSSRMPDNIRKIFAVVFGCYGGVGAVLWAIGTAAGSPGTAQVGLVLFVTGLGIYAALMAMGFFVAHIEERSERNTARRHIRSAAARDGSTAPESLADLACCDDPGIREDVAANNRTPHKILEMLAQDPHRDVRRAVALNPSASELLLLRIVEVGDPVVCDAMLSRHSGWRPLPDSVREKILQTATK